jgi:hypothetical protein
MTKIAFCTRLGMRKYEGIINKKRWVENKVVNCWIFDFDVLKPQFIDYELESVVVDYNANIED